MFSGGLSGPVVRRSGGRSIRTCDDKGVLGPSAIFRANNARNVKGRRGAFIVGNRRKRCVPHTRTRTGQWSRMVPKKKSSGMQGWRSANRSSPPRIVLRSTPLALNGFQTLRKSAAFNDGPEDVDAAISLRVTTVLVVRLLPRWTRHVIAAAAAATTAATTTTAAIVVPATPSPTTPPSVYALRPCSPYVSYPDKHVTLTPPPQPLLPLQPPPLSLSRLHRYRCSRH